MIIVPVQPSPYDVWAAQEVISLINEVSEPLSKFKTIKKCFLINRKIKNIAIGRDVEEALLAYKAPILDTHIHQRVIYAESASEGLGVSEKGNNAAAAEIEALNTEIIQKFGK